MASLAPDKFVPNNNSSAEKWIQWYKSLRSFFVRKKANAIFIEAWEKRGGINAKGNTVELRDYLQDKAGINLTGGKLSAIADFADDVGDTIGNVLTIGKWAAIAVTAVAAGGIGLVIYAIVKKPERLVLATPAGRAGVATGAIKI